MTEQELSLFCLKLLPFLLFFWVAYIDSKNSDGFNEDW